ncbi:MAG: VOC family protein [Gemmatimonadota bacterium]|nr:VOC family protein [Gemmatimonadota bacterium]
MPVKSIPDGYQAVTPYLIVPAVARLITFLQRAFGATEQRRFHRADGSVMHAEVRIRDAAVMLGEPRGEWKAMPAAIYLYVDDCDTVYQRALDAGGTSVMKPTTMHHAGERYGGVKDPSGNVWWIATHLEDLTPEEEARRIAAMAKERS